MACCALTCASCGQDPQPVREPTSWPAVCDGGPRLVVSGLDPQVHTIGAVSNVLAQDGGELWVVESSSNTVSKLTASGDFVAAALDLGVDRGPYDVAFDATRVYVTNYVVSSVSVFDRATGELVTEITHSSLDGPSGVAVLDDRLYVSNVRFRSDGKNTWYEPGTVSVFALGTWGHLSTLRTEALNPQYLSTVEVDGQTSLMVVSTGALEPEKGGDRLYLPASPSGVELWTPTDDPSAPGRQVFPLPLVESAPTVGGLGRGMVQGDTLYFTSATAPVLFTLNLTQGRWIHDALNPLRFAPTKGDALHHGHLDERGLLWITSFNEDAMYVWDTRCDALLAGPIELGVDPRLVEGPHGVWTVPNGTGADAWFIMSHGNVLGRLRVSFDPS